jgi:hypothetical protein
MLPSFLLMSTAALASDIPISMNPNSIAHNVQHMAAYCAYSNVSIVRVEDRDYITATRTPITDRPTRYIPYTTDRDQLLARLATVMDPNATVLTGSYATRVIGVPGTPRTEMLPEWSVQCVVPMKPGPVDVTQMLTELPDMDGGGCSPGQLVGDFLGVTIDWTRPAGDYRLEVVVNEIFQQLGTPYSVKCLKLHDEPYCRIKNQKGLAKNGWYLMQQHVAQGHPDPCLPTATHVP